GGDVVGEGDGGGQGVGLGGAFEQGDGDAEVGEQEGNGAAGRAGADDDDGLAGRGMVVVHGDVAFCGSLQAGLGAGDGPGRTVRAYPATASRTCPGSAPVTVRTSRPSSYAAAARAPGRPAAASASVMARTAASAASAGL